MTAVTVIVLIVLGVALSMFLASVVVGISGAWFLSVPFGTAFSLAWDKPLILFAFGIVGGALLGSSQS